MANTPLKLTPGITVNDETNVDAGVLNQLGRPLVEIEPNSLPPSVLQITPLVQAIVDAAGDSLRGKNFIPKANFWAEDWLEPDGADVADGEEAENAAEWFLSPTGGTVRAARMQEAPDGKATWCAEITGGAGVTSLDYYTYVPSGIAGGLRNTSLTFSCWIKNLYSATALVQAFIAPSEDLNSRITVVEADNSGTQSFLAGAWTRLVWTFDSTGMDNLPRGFRIGIRTASLTSVIRGLLISEVQLEASVVASPFGRPTPTAPRDRASVYPEFAGDDKLEGAELVLQMHSSGELRRFPKPPLYFQQPVLSWNAAGYPQWIDLGSYDVVLSFTGQDQFVTAPEGATGMEVLAWGAGGSNDGPDENGAVKGGVGGFTWGTFDVTPLQKFAVVVGEGKHGLNRAAYGFGGPGQGAAHQHNGGGLTGLFLNAGADHQYVAVTDTARALVIAGGAGCGGQTGSGKGAVPGGNGNDPSSSGGMPTMQGATASGSQYSGSGGGGGGFAGGTGLSLGGRGGTGFLHGDATDGAVLYAVRPSTIVPETSRPEYQAGIGTPGHNGLLVIKWTFDTP